MINHILKLIIQHKRKQALKTYMEWKRTKIINIEYIGR